MIPSYEPSLFFDMKPCESVAGGNRANPTAMLNALISLLYYLKKDWYARMISDAINKTLLIDKMHTPDLGGTFTTADIIQRIKDNVSEMYK